MDAKSLSFETAWPVTAKMTDTDLASSFMECVLASCTVQQSKGQNTRSVPASDPEEAERKLEPLAKSVQQPPITSTKIEVEIILANFSAGTGTHVERIL